MMMYNKRIHLVLLFGTLQLVAAAPSDLIGLTKVFNYQGVMPIKDDITGLMIKSESNETITADTKPPLTAEQQTEAEEACWKLINEQSVVTFALQNRVLDELRADLQNVTMVPELRTSVEKITNRMRKNMNDALDALQREAADEYFDSLFETSEDIIYLSVILRDPKMDDKVFLTLVKAVSRLGKHNSALIQEFTSMCSLVQRSPKPRFFSSAYVLA